MKFKNKKTGKVVETKDYVKQFSYSHNSLWEEVKETKKTAKSATAETE